eukprot:g302.t1
MPNAHGEEPPPPPVPAGLGSMVVREGILMKRDNLRNWKKRYFVLTGDNLECLDAKDGQTKASIPVSAELNGFSVKPQGQTPSGTWAFNVAVGARHWALAAQSEREMTEWMSVLRYQQVDAEDSLQVYIASWNVGNAQPPADLSPWIPRNGGASFYDIIAVGVQESSYESGLVGGISRGVRSLKSKESVPDKAPAGADAGAVSTLPGVDEEGGLGHGRASQVEIAHSESRLRALFALSERLSRAGLTEDRKSRVTMRLYKNVFIGREAVTWMCDNVREDAGEDGSDDEDDVGGALPSSLGECRSREDAVALGQELLAAGLLRHCNDEHGFIDGAHFYRVVTSSGARQEPGSPPRTAAALRGGGNGGDGGDGGDGAGPRHHKATSLGTSGLLGRFRTLSVSRRGHSRTRSSGEVDHARMSPRSRSRGISLGEDSDRMGLRPRTASSASDAGGGKDKDRKLSSDHFFRTVQEHVGPEYHTVASFVEPTLKEMRSIVLVHERHLPEDVETSYANTGIGGVLGNKGGLVTKLSIRGTTLGFVSCHLAPHAHKNHKRAEMLQGILQGARVGFRKLQLDSQLHHLFLFGDLNYRIDLGITDSKWRVGSKGDVDGRVRAGSSGGSLRPLQIEGDLPDSDSDGEGAARAAAASAASSVSDVSLARTRSRAAMSAAEQAQAMERLRGGDFRTRGVSLSKDVKEWRKAEAASIELKDMAAAMREAVAVEDRQYRMKTYKKCFLGTSAVSWMLRSSHAKSEAEALALGNKMLQTGLLWHVTGDHDFKNQKLFYRFAADEDPEADSGPTRITRQESGTVRNRNTPSTSSSATALSSIGGAADGAGMGALPAGGEGDAAPSAYEAEAETDRKEREGEVEAFLAHARAVSHRARSAHAQAQASVTLFSDALTLEEDAARSFEIVDKAMTMLPGMSEAAASAAGYKSGKAANGTVVESHPDGVKLQRIAGGRIVALLPEQPAPAEEEDGAPLPACQVQYNADGVRIYAPNGSQARVQMQPRAATAGGASSDRRTPAQVNLFTLPGGLTVRVADYAVEAEAAPEVTTAVEAKPNFFAMMYPNAASDRASTPQPAFDDTSLVQPERVLTTRLADGCTVTAVVPLDSDGDADADADSLLRVVGRASSGDAVASELEVEFSGDGTIQLHREDDNTVLAGADVDSDPSALTDTVSVLQRVLVRAAEAMGHVDDSVGLAEQTRGAGSGGGDMGGPSSSGGTRCTHQAATGYVTQMSADGNVIRRNPDGDVTKIFEPHAIAALAAEVVELSSALQKVERATTAESFTELISTLNLDSARRASAGERESNREMLQFSHLIQSDFQSGGEEAAKAQARKAKAALQAKSERARAALMRATSKSPHKERRRMDFETLSLLHNTPHALLGTMQSGSEEDDGEDDASLMGMSEKERKKELKRKRKMNADLMWAEVSAMLRQGSLEELYENDQLRNDIATGRILHGFAEMQPRFMPTFKVKRHRPEEVYNEKRVPSWCDRVVYRSLEGHAKRLRPVKFDSAPTLTTSDHKPVFATFEVMLPSIGAEKSRLELAPRPLGTSPALSVTHLQVKLNDTAAGEALVLEKAKEKDKEKQALPKSVYVKFYVDPPELLGAGVVKMPRTEIVPFSATGTAWSDKGIPPLHLCVRNEEELCEAHLLLAVFSKESNKKDKLLAQAQVHLGRLSTPSTTMDQARARAESAMELPPPPPPAVRESEIAPPPPPVAVKAPAKRGKRKSLLVAPMSNPAAEELRLRAESAGDLHRKHSCRLPLVLDGTVRGEINCDINIQWPLSEISLRKWLAQTTVLSVSMGLTVTRKLQESGLFSEKRKKKMKTCVFLALALAL